MRAGAGRDAMLLAHAAGGGVVMDEAGKGASARGRTGAQGGGTPSEGDELGGYREYAQKTRYRLLPGIW